MHRNIQQMKEHDKNPQDQTNEEEIGSLPEKGSRVIIVKMIQNLGNQMEAQINRLKAQIEMIQGKFNKDLEKLKNKQSTMNTAIIEIKNTLKGTNSRVSEAEEHISELDDKNPQDKTNKEEIGSLPEIKLRVMIVKMIQNLENKTEALINRLEAWIEKMKEMSNKKI